jgi:hypothetical protein
MNWRKVFLILGIIFILAGVFLPRDWYDAVPKSEADLTWIRQDEPVAPTQTPPIKGVTLLQISFVIEGLAFLWLGWETPDLRAASGKSAAFSYHRGKQNRFRLQLVLVDSSGFGFSLGSAAVSARFGTLA